MVNNDMTERAFPPEQVGEMLIKVDRFGREDGTVDKRKAHEKGVLHRAISVCIFDAKGRWLLQKRSPKKYHSAGLLANACCGHPRPNEDTPAAAQRRVHEELGISCPLHFCSSFVYKTKVTDGLTEYEFDHLYVGFYNEDVHPDPKEVESILFLEEKEIETQLKNSPHLFAAWFPFVFREVMLHKNNLLKAAPGKII